METLSLFELNKEIRNAMLMAFPETYWVIAEISELRTNRSGHCYLELIEKDIKSNELLARAKATIWSFTYRMLKPYFETSTGRSLEAGLIVLVSVSVEFHEQYGFSLNIKDIEPAYTLGDLARQRKEIINRLENEGVINMNRELEFPMVPQRIAVISSSTAAGYDDFMNQLGNNPYGYKIYPELMEADMQGSKAEDSIVAALDRIYLRAGDFDLVAIIRGGGSKADLGCFDGYRLAFHITQFPLPVITGIGHERDDSVADLVAHTRLKTPTAVAEFIILHLSEFDQKIYELAESAVDLTNEILKSEKDRMEHSLKILSPLTFSVISGHKNNLELKTRILPVNIHKYYVSGIQTAKYSALKLRQITFSLVAAEKQRSKYSYEALNNECHHIISSIGKKLDRATGAISILDPVNVLKRGYSITSFKGRPVKNAEILAEGSEISTRLYRGSFKSRLIKENNQENKNEKD